MTKQITRGDFFKKLSNGVLLSIGAIVAGPEAIAEALEKRYPPRDWPIIEYELLQEFLVEGDGTI